MRGLALAAAIVGAACSSQAGNPPDVARPELVIPARATHVATGPARATGGVEVSYEVEIPYPADALLARIKAALPPERWEPLTKRLLDSKAETSHAAGWTTAVMTRSSGDRIVHGWDGEWLDREGNFVAYELRYDSPWVLQEALVKQPTNSTLRVVATWLPAATAATLQRFSRSSGGGQ